MLKKIRENEDGMTLVEVIAAMVIILLVMTATAGSFLQLQRVQDATNLRAQAHDLVTTTMMDYQDYPFDRIGINSSLVNVPKEDGGLGGQTTYTPPIDGASPENIKLDSKFNSSLVKHKAKKLIGAKQYDMTTYVTTPPVMTDVDYQPVRVTLEINLGDTAGVIKETKLIFPQIGACAPKKFADPHVSSYEGCK